jgi:AraC-like DNA-binding protein
MTNVILSKSKKLKHNTLLECSSYELFHELVSLRFSKHHVTPATSFKDRVEGRIAGVTLASGITLTYVSYGSKVIVEDVNNENYIINLPRDDIMEMWIGKECFVNNQDNAVINSPGNNPKIMLPLTGCLGLRIDRHLIENACRDLTGMEVPAVIQFRPDLSINSPFGRILSVKIAEILNRLDSGSVGLIGSIAKAQFAEFLLNDLLLQHPSNVSRQLIRKTPSAGLLTVKRAEALLSARYNEPLRLGQVATELGVSLRSLHRSFSLHRDYTAQQYLHKVRLEAVRNALTSADHGLNVSSAASAHGFTHLGRFPADYARYFGELPSETLSRAVRRH